MGIRRTKSDELEMFGQEPGTAANRMETAASSDYLQQRQERIEMLLIQNIEVVKSLSQRINDLSERVMVIEKNVNTMHHYIGNEIAEGFKKARFLGNLDPENYTRLNNVFNAYLLKQKKLEDEYIQKCEKQLSNHREEFREMLKNNEGTWFSTLGLKIWACTIFMCVLLSFLHSFIK